MCPENLQTDRLVQIARRAMVERGLEPDFDAATLTELASLQRHAAPPADVRDLRHMLWSSIDNDDSRDLDQIEVAAPASNGATKIFVGIADVDALVRKGSAIDGHARTNTTSVYTAAKIFPMLPEKLSTGLTSLNDGQERLAIVIEMEVGQDGAVGASEIYRATVLNRAKLAYSSVAAWLEGSAPPLDRVSAVPGMEQQLRMQDRVAQVMKARRHRQGALTLASTEARPVFDGGILTDLRPDEKNRATELIEDFMIAANGVTARYLTERGFPAMRRVLRSPERWARIVDLARDNGHQLPAIPDARALEEFLSDCRKKDPDRFPDLSLSVVKLLGRGEYVLELPGESGEGHFGLAVKDYTHSTAPNRRFPDLITQRLLKAALAGAPAPYGSDELRQLAAHCTEQEDNAAKVERQVQKSAAALLLQSRVGERFDGIVTGVSPKGTWVRIVKPAVEGKVVRGDQGIDVGDRVRVELIATDVERGYIDFARVTDR